MHETYADFQIAFVDAKVASAMCKGGAITYAKDDLTGISDDWILEHVVPCMVAHGINLQVWCWAGLFYFKFLTAAVSMLFLTPYVSVL